MELQDVKSTFEDQIKNSELKIFHSSTPMRASDIQEQEEYNDGRKRRRAVFSSSIEEINSDDEEESDDDDKLESISGPVTENDAEDGENDHLSFADSDSDLGDEFAGDLNSEEVSATKWKAKLKENAQKQFPQVENLDLMGLVYGDIEESQTKEQEDVLLDDGLFKVKKPNVTKTKGLSSIDSTKLETSDEIINEWAADKVEFFPYIFRCLNQFDIAL